MRVETYALFWGVDFLSRRIGRRLSAEQDAEMLRECGGDSPDAPYVMLERRRAAQAAYEIMMTPSSTEDVDRPEFGRPVERILGLFPSTSAPNTYLLYRRAMLTLYRELPDHESRRDFLHDLFDLLEQDVNGGLTAPQLAEGRGEYVVGEQQSQMLVGADPRLTAICQILQSRFVPGRHGDLFSVPSDIGNVLRREGPLPEVGQWVGIISGRREMYVAAPPPAFERRDPIIRLRRYDRRDCDTRWEEYGNVGSRAVERGSYTGGDRSPEERDTVPYVVWNAQTGRIEPLFGCRSIVQLQRSLNVQEESRRQAMLHYLSTPYDRERGQLVCMQALKDILGLCAYQEVVEQLGTGMDAIQNTKFDLYYGLKDLYWNARDQRAFLRELVEILTARKALPDGTMVRAGLISTPIKDKIIEHFQRRFPQRRGNEAVA
jgi:hypothetical protein